MRQIVELHMLASEVVHKYEGENEKFKWSTCENRGDVGECFDNTQRRTQQNNGTNCPRSVRCIYAAMQGNWRGAISRATGALIT